MSEHASVWLTEPARARYPGLDGDVDVDVAVVGGGIVGLTTALLLQREGLRTALIEAGRVAGGTTGHTTGKVTSQHGLVYRGLIERLGVARARLYATANEEAINTIERLATEVDADCQFQRAAAFVYAVSSKERSDIEAEHRAAIELGLPATLTTDTELPFSVEVALRFDRQAHFHAVRYCDGLARAFVAAGGKLVEHTRATAVDERDGHIIVRAPGGDVRAEHVVVASLMPFVDRGGFFAKSRPTRAYGIAARLRRDAPDGMYISAGSPVRSIRPWVDGDRRGLIVVGENHATGEGDAGPQRWGSLERWAREHFDVDSFAYRWSSQDFATPDSVPYVGRSPRTSRVYVATGFNKWGLTNGTAAASVLVALLQGRNHEWHELFDATRIGNARTVKQLIFDNLHVARHFVQDRLGRLLASSPSSLGRGEAGIVKVNGETVGAYRDAHGVLHAVSNTCTHLGCALKWNAAETSWDCPCHGSRFGHDGTILNGPAVRELARRDVSDTNDG